MGDYIHGVKYHEVKNTVVKYNVSLITRRDLVHSISAHLALYPGHTPPKGVWPGYEASAH